MKEIITKSSQETQKIGRILGQELKNKTSLVLQKSNLKNEQALVIGLEGDLGGGKTTFVQGLAQGLKIKEQVTSPSFVLIKKYKFPVLNSQFQFFYHIDCYRLNRPQELLELDFAEIIKNPKNLVIIEWAEKVASILPEEKIMIKFDWVDENKRRITIDNIPFNKLRT